MKQAAHI